MDKEHPISLMMFIIHKNILFLTSLLWLLLGLLPPGLVLSAELRVSFFPGVGLPVSRLGARLCRGTLGGLTE